LFEFKNGIACDRCPKCKSSRLISHPELNKLHIAHIDCDAFYASIEKRDNPLLKNKPVIVGGGKRGVVAACCYISRIKGVHSAMPMYKALKACPDAEIISPNMKKYTRVGREIKNLMLKTTPLVESISIDEAFLDLNGTQKLHHAHPIKTLVKLSQHIETEIGITVSIGLSYNKFLAKTASDLEKPRGFKIIGKLEAISFLGPRPIGSIWGVGKSMKAQLEKDGFKTISQLREITEQNLIKRYGKIGKRLFHFARGEDNRSIQPNKKSKSISKEITFVKNIDKLDQLLLKLWPLCESISYQLKIKELAASTITIKLKTNSFKTITRSRTFQQPTQLGEIIYQEAKLLLKDEITGVPYRLIGIGVKKFSKPEDADLSNLLDKELEHIVKIESTMEIVRRKFGQPSIKKGRALLK
jgi:DNA polymerase-4